ENGAKDSNARFNSAWQKRGGESQGRDASSTIIKGQKILDELDRMGIKRAEYKTAVRSIADHEDARTLLSLATMQLLDGIEKVFDMLEGGAESYAFCFQHWPEEARYAINIWLLDPSVVFGPLVKRVHAIALLSGTLTPFASFTSELRHTFGHQLVAPHVLKDERVFVASISKGHLGRELCGTYQTAETKEYLDQIVGIVKDVAARVGSTGGVLVFVPNYAFLGKLAKRLAGAIAEPRAGGGAEFDRALRQFQGRIAQKQEAVMLCVYRGKASEGLNFQDSYARAVIAIGIPYPSIRDPQIQLKKEYNDRNSTYNGRQWYEAQAYRAMNQALGRAIRHANDWGAIFLLDSRLAEPRAQQSLSSWVSRNIRRYEHYAASCDELDAFVNRNK
ncbi:fanconi anemia group J protein, partial [Pancytospora philotis]